MLHSKSPCSEILIGYGYFGDSGDIHTNTKHSSFGKSSVTGALRYPVPGVDNLRSLQHGGPSLHLDAKWVVRFRVKPRALRMGTVCGLGRRTRATCPLQGSGLLQVSVRLWLAAYCSERSVRRGPRALRKECHQHMDGEGVTGETAHRHEAQRNQGIHRPPCVA